MITLENLWYKYPKAKDFALQGINLTIPAGSFFALLGPNGAGKTTLLRLLCGRLGNFKGQLKIDDFLKKDNFLNPAFCGILLENPGIYPKLSIKEYINYFLEFYAKNATWNPHKTKAKILEIAKKLELPNLDLKMGKLSLGNRQKVQILRAMAPQPKLLILDEPVANLDPLSREMVWDLLADFRKEGGTAIVCSHILAEMENEATDFAIINKGKVLKSGKVHLINESSTEIFKVKTSADAKTIAKILAAAHISAEISPLKLGLSELYKDTVEN